MAEENTDKPSMSLMRNACNYARTELGWAKAVAGGELFADLTGHELTKQMSMTIGGLDVKFIPGWKPGKRKQLTGMPIYRG